MSYATIIDYEAGHLQIVTEEYWRTESEEKELPLEHLLFFDDELHSAIQRMERIVAASPELSFQARLNNGWDELPVHGKGIDPETFGNVFAWSTSLLRVPCSRPMNTRRLWEKD